MLSDYQTDFIVKLFYSLKIYLDYKNAYLESQKLFKLDLCIMYWTKITIRIVLKHIFIRVFNESWFYFRAITSPVIPVTVIKEQLAHNYVKLHEYPAP